jgi:uncharacterized membrane protein
MKTKFEHDLKERMRRDPNNYKLGIIYFNRLDSRYIVPKPNQSFGWTLNFGHPYVFFVLLGILVSLILGGLFTSIF